MAIVYKAFDLTNNTDVVIKVPKQSALEDKTFLKRFAAENRALLNLRHPHIVQILHVGENEGWPFTVLQYLTGGDLEVCREEFSGKLSLLNVSKWMPNISQALDFIHGQGYVHRDVKPANILFDGEGRAFLSDFGVAKVVSEQASKMTKLTGTGMVLGTPDYMAPELIMGQPIDGRVDQYALGTTIYECLTGRLPFRASTPAAVLVMQATGKMPPLEKFNPDIPQAVSKTIMRALAKKPAERFPTCQAFAQELLSVIDESDNLAAAPPMSHPMTAVMAAPNNHSKSVPTSIPKVIDEVDASQIDTSRRRSQTQPAFHQPNCKQPQRTRRSRKPTQQSVWQDKRFLFASAIAAIVALLILIVIYPSQPILETKQFVQGTLDSQTKSNPPEPEMKEPQSEPSQPVQTTEPMEPEPSPSIPTPAEPMKSELMLPPKSEKPALLTAPFDSNTARDSQRAWATFLGKPDFVETNSIGMKMVLVPPGEFMMGSPSNEKDRQDNESQHRVRITQPFYLGQHEVTRGQFATFVAEMDYRTEAETDGRGGYGWNESTGKSEGPDPKYNWRNSGFPQTDAHPVLNISWNDAAMFCNWLSKKEGVSYLLPKEAEWEYACRAGTTTLYQHGDNPEGLTAVGNVADGTGKEKHPDWIAITAQDGYIYTAPVGGFKPNAFNLYDLHGNVWEWCADSYATDHSTNSEFDDPKAASMGSFRVYRGGSWSYAAKLCRSALRYKGGVTPARQPGLPSDDS